MVLVRVRDDQQVDVGRPSEQVSELLRDELLIALVRAVDQDALGAELAQHRIAVLAPADVQQMHAGHEGDRT